MASDDEHQRKRSRRDEDGGAESVGKEADPLVCVLCMEEGTSSNPLLPNHQCPQCVPDAWKVCTVCNEALLSRVCPVCRGEYAPIVMHKMPGLPFKRLADSSLSEEEKSSLLYKFGIVRQVIGKSNVAVWSKKQEKMFFSLPEKTVGGSDESSFIVTSIALKEEDVGEDVFLFSNKIWDLIENEVESGAVQAGESVDYSGAAQFILRVTREDDHRLFTMLSPADWDYTLNPDTSSDVHDTLQAIKLNILHNVERVIPRRDREAK